MCDPRFNLENQFEPMSADRNYYEECFEYYPLPYLRVNRAGSINNLNRSLSKLVARDMSSLINFNFKLLLTNDSRFTFDGFLAMCFATQQEQSCELRLMATDYHMKFIKLIGIVPPDKGYCILTAIDITESKFIELSTLSTHADLQSLLDAIPDLLFEVDLEGKYYSYHTNRQNLLFIYPTSFIGKNISDTLPGDVALICMNAIRTAYEDGFVRDIQYEVPIAGEIRTFELSVTRKQNKYLDSPRFLAMSRDITKQKQLENSLNQVLYDLMQRQFAIDQHAIVGITNEEGDIQFVNERFAEISKYSYNELLGQNHRILNSGYHNKEFFVTMYKTIKNGKTWQGEIRNRAKDGSYYWVATTIVPLKKETGEIEKFISIRTDITERVIAEEKLKFSELRFHTIFDLMPLGIALIESKTGKIIQVNPKFSEILGYEESELTKLYFQDITHPDDLWEHLEKLRLLFEGKTQLLSMENRYIHKNNNLIWVNINYVPLVEPNKELNYHILIISDITKAKEANQKIEDFTRELQALNATKDKFFKIIAHDLRNPFAGIMGLSEILEQKLHENPVNQGEDLLKFATLIRTSSKSAFNLLENLMHWARTQTGEIAINPTNISFNAVVNNAIPVIVGNAAKKNIVIEFESAKDQMIYADEQSVHTILRNLLTNAIKFSYPNSKIILSTKTTQTHLEISIIDTGIGIKEANLNKLFRIDSKVSKLGTQNETGTGLGLILCKEFIEKQGGSIWVTSDYEKGSTFTFTLPLGI